VKYEAASQLTSLTQNPAAVKGACRCLKSVYTKALCKSMAAAASTYIELLVKESDNNVKLIALDRFEALRSRHEHVLDDLVMEVLRVLSRSVSVT
jgi:coatomer subunit beta